LFSIIYIPAAAKQAAEKGFVWGKAPENIPSAAKADVDLIGFMRGINPPPPSVASFSAACKAENLFWALIGTTEVVP